MQTQSVTIEIEKYRENPASRHWDLPPWGHPLGQGVLPLFINFENRLIPVGTAFTIGRGVTFVVSAMHVIREAWKREERLSHLLHLRDLPTSVNLKHTSFSVLLHRPTGSGGISFIIWPLETVEGAPPTDVVIGYPQFQTEFATLVNRLSFDLPASGEKVWSVGYCDFRVPEGGIPLDAVRNGAFDWEKDYCHTFRVVEGFVERIFTQRFAAGFVEGPCFTFDAATFHAQSGGPILSSQGFVRGVNSAGAEMYLNRPSSIGALIYPLLFMQLRFGAQIGPMRINTARPLVDLVADGTIPTDGSEERVCVGKMEDGQFCVNPRAELTMTNFIHDDFSGFQRGELATVKPGPYLRLRKVDRDPVEGN